jgi:hypothetical protein
MRACLFAMGVCQAECIKFLYDRMRMLHGKFETTENAADFPRPIFHIMVLFVDEQIAVDRQLARGFKVLAHNEQVLDPSFSSMPCTLYVARKISSRMGRKFESLFPKVRSDVSLLV